MTRLGDLVVDSIATYRLARLVVDDAILDEQRERLFRWLDPPPPSDWEFGYSTIEGSALAGAPFPGSRKVAEGLGCYWCVGIWIAGAVVATRRTIPRTWSPVAGAVAEQT